MYKILDTLGSSHFQLSLYFLIYVWLVYLLRYYYAKKYQLVTDVHQETTSVIVPVYKEDSLLFRKCLSSIVAQNPSEIIVVVNGGDPEMERIAHSYGCRVFTLAEPHKRAALVLGIRKAIGKIVVLVDSDTIFTPDALKELIKPFRDRQVGGVTTRQKIFDHRANMIRRIAGCLEDFRFGVTQPAQSSVGAVGCLPGRAVAFRRQYLLPHLDEIANQKFMGKLCISGDDRFMTLLMLKNGYKTLYHASALVYTDCPNRFSGLVKQQLRWARSSQRETLLSLTWLYKYPLTFFCFITDIITPFFFMAILTNSIVGCFFWDIITTQPHLLGWTLLGILGMNVSLSFTHKTQVKLYSKDILFFIVLLLFITIGMGLIQMVGLLSMRNQDWMTRK